MFCIRLPKDLEKRLDSLSKQTHRPKAFYVREALAEKIDELEDVYIALKRLEKPEPTSTLEEVRKKLGLDD